MGEANAGLTIRELVLDLRDEVASLANEIRDTRAQVAEDQKNTRHQVRVDIRAIELRVVELEHFRVESERRHRLAEERADKYIPMVETLSSQAKISEAVKAALSESETRGWTKRERIMAIGLFTFSAIGALGTLFTVFVLRVVE